MFLGDCVFSVCRFVYLFVCLSVFMNYDEPQYATESNFQKVKRKEHNKEHPRTDSVYDSKKDNGEVSILQEISNTCFKSVMF